MMFLKWIYLTFLIQEAFAFQAAFRKAVVHIDRITQDDHTTGGIIERIPLPPGLGLGNLVSFSYTYYSYLFIYRYSIADDVLFNGMRQKRLLQCLVQREFRMHADKLSALSSRWT